MINYVALYLTLLRNAVLRNITCILKNKIMQYGGLENILMADAIFNTALKLYFKSIILFSNNQKHFTS